MRKNSGSTGGLSYREVCGWTPSVCVKIQIPNFPRVVQLRVRASVL